MQISIVDPVQQTYIFIVLLLIVLAVSLRKKTSAGSLGIETTHELKGFAILAIVFAHIGYFLAADTRFLFPLSVLAGVGVDLFLFVSGFGLTTSALSRELSVWQFYSRRLKKIYVPLWIVLSGFLVMDYLVLHKTYAGDSIAHAFFGWFPSANLFSDINSPFWYLSLILLYYLLFPLLFSRRWVPLSVLGVYAVTYTLAWWIPEGLRENMPLYQTHLIAFPLGMIAAWFLRGRESVGAIQNNALYYSLLAALVGAIGYLAIHSGVGKEPWIAADVSMITVFLIVVLFVVKRFEIRLLYLFGVFSFEVYLLHWPLMERYDIFFKFLPASLALVAYLALFLGLGWLLQYTAKKIDTT